MKFEDIVHAMLIYTVFLFIMLVGAIILFSLDDMDNRAGHEKDCSWQCGLRMSDLYKYEEPKFSSSKCLCINDSGYIKQIY